MANRMGEHSFVRPSFALAVFALVLLFPSASATTPQGSQLNLTVQGIITSAGTQQYALSGGQLVQGEAFSTPLPSLTTVQYNLNATVTGLQTSGEATVQVTAPGAHGLTLLAKIEINSEVAAAVFPVTPEGASCNPATSSCNSEIPLLFEGVASITTTQGVQDGHNAARTVTLPVAIESAYWNPFGGPIVITSLDSQTSPSLLLIVTYTKATIGWSGVELAGVMAGTVGQKGVKGQYLTVGNSQENLLTGTQIDSGSISFVDTTAPLPDASGTYFGFTTTPKAGSFDCSKALSLPEGTCLATGANSVGAFTMTGPQSAFVTGTYTTVWSVPSLTTTTTISGTVIQSS